MLLKERQYNSDGNKVKWGLEQEVFRGVTGGRIRKKQMWEEIAKAKDF